MSSSDAGAAGPRVLSVYFTSFAGGQVRSLLSLISYFGKGENRERYLGVKIPPTNLKPDYLEQARAFAAGLADGLRDDGASGAELSTQRRKPAWAAERVPAGTPRLPSASASYKDAVTQLDTTLEARQDRLESAAGGIPAVILVLLLFDTRPEPFKTGILAQFFPRPQRGARIARPALTSQSGSAPATLPSTTSETRSA